MEHQDRQKVVSTPIIASLSSLLGTCLEWYDFYIYGTASALVFNFVFFPQFDPNVGTMLAFATFAIGAVIRPLGGVIFGHFGDTIGRKAMLVWTLLIMGFCTVAIGALPGYEKIGVMAPIALIVLRAIQSLALGGEWAGAVLMSVEHAPPKRASFFGSIPQMGSPLGLFLSAGSFALLSRLPHTDFLVWAWRIPFLASGVLILIGLVFRLKLHESPSFVSSKNARNVIESPVLKVLFKNKRATLQGAGVVLCAAVAFYVQAVFVVSYATQRVGAHKETVLSAVLVSSLVEVILLPLFAALADRITDRRVALFGVVYTGLFAFPFFSIINSTHFFNICVGISLAAVGISALFAVLPTFLSSLFPTNVRYTGVSLAYGIGMGVFGGLTPVVASSMFVWANSAWPIALSIVVVSIISGACIALDSPEASQIKSMQA